jgi:hypothetical protein
LKEVISVDYKSELDKATRLYKALNVIHRGCQGLKPKYEPLNGLVCNFVLGFIPVINVQCPEDPDCRVEASTMYGGLEDLLENLEVVIYWLEMEVCYEGVQGMQ